MLYALQHMFIEAELEDVYTELTTTCNKLNTITEDVTIPKISNDSITSLMLMMADAEKRYAATKRGLSLVSKLKPGPERAKHFSRITSNMNKLRAYNNRINKAIEQLST